MDYKDYRMWKHHVREGASDSYFARSLNAQAKPSVMRTDMIVFYRERAEHHYRAARAIVTRVFGGSDA